MNSITKIIPSIEQNVRFFLKNDDSILVVDLGQEAPRLLELGSSESFFLSLIDGSRDLDTIFEELSLKSQIDFIKFIKIFKFFKHERIIK